METDNLPRRDYLHPVHFGLVALAMGLTGLEYVQRSVVGNDLFFDAAERWLPFANAVLSGATPYVEPAIDNKPPLWQYLNLAAAATGQYELVMYTAVALANAAGALLLYSVLETRGFDARVATLSSLFYVAALPPLNGTIINVRSFAVVGVLFALHTTTPIRRGAAIALAGLVCQYAVLAIPILVYDYYQQTGDISWRWLTRFTGSGLATVGVVFLPLVAYGWPAVSHAFYWSFLSIGEYATYSHHPDLAHNPKRWVAMIVHATTSIGYIVFPAAAGLCLQTRSRRVGIWGLLAVVLAAPLFLRSFLYYWVLPLPFLSLLAAETLVSIPGIRPKTTPAAASHANEAD